MPPSSRDSRAMSGRPGPSDSSWPARSRQRTARPLRDGASVPSPCDRVVRVVSFQSDRRLHAGRPEGDGLPGAPDPVRPGLGAVCELGAELADRSEEHTSELQSQSNLVCRLLLEKKKKKQYRCSLNSVAL